MTPTPHQRFSRQQAVPPLFVWIRRNHSLRPPQRSSGTDSTHGRRPRRNNHNC